MNPQQTQQPTQLDPHLVNLAKAIRQTESGGNFTAKGKSGEYGAYQFTDPTWNAEAPKYGVNVPLEKATPEQQNQVAYKQLESWKTEHPDWNIGHYASAWNAGIGEANAFTGKFSNGQPSVGKNKLGVQFDVPAYAKSVASAYQTIKNGGQVGADPNNPSSVASPQQTTPDASGATFPASGDESLVGGALKTLGNIPSSAFGFAKGIINSFNPLAIASTISQIPSAFQGAVEANGGVGNAIKNTVESLPGEAYKAVVPQAARQAFSGDFSGARQTIENDPVGQIAPFLLGAKGLAEKGGLGEGFDNAVTKTTEGVAKPIAKTASAVVGGVGTVIRSAASHLAGLEPDTITQILSSPEAFSKIAKDQVDRGGLAGEVKTALDTRLENLEETGSGYDPIKKSPNMIDIGNSDLASMIEKNTGLKLGKEGFESSAMSPVDAPTDVGKINRFYQAWQPYFDQGQMTPKEFLTMRSKLASIANYEGIGKSSPLESAAGGIREALNTKYRKNIPGLESLDADFSTQKTELKALSKGILDKDGNLKDTAINKIANSTGLGKDRFLSQLEEISPGITKRVKILKAVEDIDRAKGNKIGTYTRGALEGGAVLTGNIPAILAAIITHPTMATKIIRVAGLTGSKLETVTSALRVIAGDVNKAKPKGKYIVPTSVVGANTQKAFR